MKLKYYMRGLGIGIVLTTLVFTISNTKEKLSDQEIINRAEELGMVMEEESNENLDKALDSIKNSGNPTVQPTSLPEVSPDVTPTQKPTPEPTATPMPTKAPTPEPTKAPTPEPMPTNAPVKNDDKKEITFTIKRGMSSDQVAALLLEKGLIKNADDFNRYIVKVGKASTIRVGTYTVLQDASYDDIIKKITAK